MKMKLRFSESEINYWANRYTERQREKDRMKEQQLIDLKSDVQERGYLTKEEIAQNSALEINKTGKPYFRKHRRLDKRNYGNGIHSPR